MAGVKKRSIAMDMELYEKALERSKELGYQSFSAYIQFLITSDCENKPDHVRSSKKGLYFETKSPLIARLNEPVNDKSKN